MRNDISYFGAKICHLWCQPSGASSKWPKSRLKDASLVEAIRHRFEAVEQRLNIVTELRFPTDLDFDAETRFELYRIIIEALNNSLKHSEAKAVSVQVEDLPDRYLFTVSDNGVGFNPADITPGMGLNHINERVRQIHATIKIESCPGSGTRVLVGLPK